MELYQYLEGNLAALKEVGSPAHAWLGARTFDLPALRQAVTVNRFGLLDWRLPGTSLFASAHPESFYQGWTPENLPEASASLLIGANLGYGVNHLLTKTPERHKIYLLEPRAEMLVACLGQSDYRPYIKSRRLIIVPPDEALLAKVIQRLDLEFLFGRIFLREDLPSRQLGPEYARWYLKAKARLENFSVELSTLRQKQDVMVGNELANFERAARDGSLSPLRGTAHGLTAVILGAGPSLARFAPALAANPGRALYATALQTLPALQSHGLVPHFCMAIDYSPGMHHVFAKLDREFAARVPLVYSTKLDPQVLARYPGPTLPLWTMGGLSTFLKREDELVIDAGGNVGVTLFRFLSWCGVSAVLLAGQDFGCAETGPTHAGGHHADRLTAASSPAFSVRLKNADGEPIRSSPQMMAAKRDLEDDLKKAGVAAYNLYGGGAVINGARHVDLDAVAELGLLACASGLLDRFTSGLTLAGQPRPKPVFEPRAPQWAASLRQAEKRLDKLFKHPGKNLQEIRTHLHRIEFFLKQDPLYFPYLFNEIADMAGLARARSHYQPTDQVQARNILRRALAKVREMDRVLAPASRRAA